MSDGAVSKSTSPQSWTPVGAGHATGLPLWIFGTNPKIKKNKKK
jgi:hypothetical protein